MVNICKDRMWLRGYHKRSEIVYTVMTVYRDDIARRRVIGKIHFFTFLVFAGVVVVTVFFAFVFVAQSEETLSFHPGSRAPF